MQYIFETVKKKKYLIYVFIAIFFFTYGFLTHRNHIFPFKFIKKIQNQFIPKFNLDQYEAEIKEEYKNWNEDNTNYKKVILKKYYPGLNIFLDRNYFNHLNDDKLKKLYLVQLQRHYANNIKLNVTNETIIYRILCQRNNNDRYKDWKKENFELLIIGEGCIAQEVRSKKFKKGTINLIPGGPMSSDPIFILKKSPLDLITLG
jgi:hypothetical protein